MSPGLPAASLPGPLVAQPMKFRSALLFACMLVVPAVAMFSHRLPSGMRVACRTAISNAVARWTSSATSAPVQSQEGGEFPAAVLAGESVAQAATNTKLKPIAPPAPASPVTANGPSPLIDHDRRQWEDGLGQLGAIRIECRPLSGADGVHVATCGVPLDASGQLVRVFHASGTDPAAATRALFDDVAGWKQRSAGRIRSEPVVGGQPVADRLRF